MNDREIVIEALKTTAERPLTKEETAAFVHAVVNEVKLERDAVTKLIDALGAATSQGLELPADVRVALLNIVIIRLTGRAILT